MIGFSRLTVLHTHLLTEKSKIKIPHSWLKRKRTLNSNKETTRENTMSTLMSLLQDLVCTYRARPKHSVGFEYKSLVYLYINSCNNYTSHGGTKNLRPWIQILLHPSHFLYPIKEKITPATHNYTLKIVCVQTTCIIVTHEN